MENVHFYFPLFDHFYIDIYTGQTKREKEQENEEVKQWLESIILKWRNKEKL